MLRRLGFLLSWIGALLGGALILAGIFYGEGGTVAWPALGLGGFIVLIGLALRYLFAG